MSPPGFLCCSCTYFWDVRVAQSQPVGVLIDAAPPCGGVCTLIRVLPCLYAGYWGDVIVGCGAQVRRGTVYPSCSSEAVTGSCICPSSGLQSPLGSLCLLCRAPHPRMPPPHASCSVSAMWGHWASTWALLVTEGHTHLCHKAHGWIWCLTKRRTASL